MAPGDGVAQAYSEAGCRVRQDSGVSPATPQPRWTKKEGSTKKACIPICRTGTGGGEQKAGTRQSGTFCGLIREGDEPSTDVQFALFSSARIEFGF